MGLKRGACVCAQLCLNLHDPVDCSPRGSSVHGILQAKMLEWAPISFSRMKMIYLCQFYEIAKGVKGSVVERTPQARGQVPALHSLLGGCG